MNPHLLFEYPLVVREAHLDLLGHVNNATYLELFEEARWQIVTERGFGLAEVQSRGLGPVILEVYIRFVRELRLRDSVVIRTQLQSVDRKIFTLKQWIVNGQGILSCEADFKGALFDTKARAIVDPTTEWLNAIGAV